MCTAVKVDAGGGGGNGDEETEESRAGWKMPPPPLGSLGTVVELKGEGHKFRAAGNARVICGGGEQWRRGGRNTLANWRPPAPLASGSSKYHSFPLTNFNGKQLKEEHALREKCTSYIGRKVAAGGRG